MIIKIKVKTHSGKSEILNVGKEDYLVNLKSFPEDNKANIELLKLLKKHFNVERNRIKIIKGRKSREKIIEIK